MRRQDDTGDAALASSRVLPLLNGEWIPCRRLRRSGTQNRSKLIVTNFKPLFQPRDLGLANDLIKWGCKAFQVPHAPVVTCVGGKAKQIVDATAQGVSDIVAVETVGQASLFDPPKIRMSKADG